MSWTSVRVAFVVFVMPTSLSTATTGPHPHEAHTAPTLPKDTDHRAAMRRDGALGTVAP